MKINHYAILTVFAGSMLMSCGSDNTATDDTTGATNKKDTVITSEISADLKETFGDIQVLQYDIPGFYKLSLKQQKLVYYLYEAGLSGRDIIWDQNYRHNLAIRSALENIVKNYDGDKTTDDWKNFMEYTNRVWFANGIHHHYSKDKFIPKFSQVYFNELMANTSTTLSEDIITAIFDKNIDAKRVSLDSKKDLVLSSATNFYGPNVTQKDVEDFYAEMMANGGDKPVEFGLNSRLVKDADGNVSEEVWKVGGKYSAAIEEVVKWLTLAQGVAENEEQGKALGLLIEYYQTGDLEKWSEFNITWSQATEGDIDYIQGFVEVYGDPKGMRGAYESIVQIKDFDASARMKVMADNVQWFEDQSSIADEHKKPDVTGVSYKVVNVAGEAGDASPSTPIGVNLPNNEWIREVHGSKSVSLGNIVEANNNASGDGILAEFANDQEQIERAKTHGKLAAKLHTAMHEVIGHASGKLNQGVGTPKETLKNYASTLEEARADLVSLYFFMDEKLIELGLMETLEVGKAAYDNYILNGLMTQLQRLEIGDKIEQAHMRNRQLVASWAFEKGTKDNVISKEIRDGKTYFEINDYVALKEIFGDLLKEIQRIKSEGDYEAGHDLVENYGVKVDEGIHAEVLERSAALNIPPYNGFMNPVLTAVQDDNGEIIGITLAQPTSFAEQMLDYSARYGFLK